MVDRYKFVVGNVTATAHAAAHPDGQYVNWHEYEALRAEVERLRSNRSLPMGMIAITIYEWDRVKLGHDRYEAVRRASLRQMREIWEAALRGDTRFDEAVDRLRDADPTPAAPERPDA